MDALDSKTSQTQFVISFIGTSITAGHSKVNDCELNVANFVHEALNVSFDALGIQLVTVNGGIGNYPCMPLDICASVFAGNQADIVHWEHTIACHGNEEELRPTYESFIRQTLALQNQPIIAMSASTIPNWTTDDCPVVDNSEPQIMLTPDDVLALSMMKSNPIYAYSVLNKNDSVILSEFSAMADLFHYFSNYSGLQLFRHDFGFDYKCRGPYISKWGNTVEARDFHPSLLGNRLWADHLSYVWLQGLREAVQELISGLKLNSDFRVIRESISQETNNPDYKYYFNLVDPLYPSHYANVFKCFTTFQPIADVSLNLTNLVIPPRTLQSRKPFEIDIWEKFAFLGSYLHGIEKHCIDKKWVYYGNQYSQPLSFKLEMSKFGNVFICTMQPPRSKFLISLDDICRVYLTENVNTEVDYFDFDFDFNIFASREIPLTYNHFNSYSAKNFCVELSETVSPGNHILTLVPTSEKLVMISFLFTT